MREQVRDIERLWHIDECIGHIINFLEGKTFEEMKSDVMCFHAVVHGYYTVSPQFVWETYSKDLGPLREQVKQYIAELQK